MKHQWMYGANYWNSIVRSGLIFGLIVFALNIIGGYMTIQTEPTGIMFEKSVIFGFISCFIGAFGGLLAVKLQVGEYSRPLLIGDGATIGFTTGVLIALVFSGFGLLWNAIDPDFTQKMIEASIANVKVMDQIPEAQKKEMIDSITSQMQRMQTPVGIFTAFGMNAILYGVLNLLTGMLGVRFFAVQ